MRGLGLLDAENLRVIEPRMASMDDLTLFHTADYLQFVKKMSAAGTGLLDSGDTPAFKGCFEASALATGASLTAVDVVMSGQVEHAMNISGRLHHDHVDHASGFCVFNDPAVAIAYLKHRYHLNRIVYLDIDAHHGDGVMYGFYDDPTLLDVDFHEDGRHLFPGTGSVAEIGEGDASGLKINIPLPPFMGDASYRTLFREIVPKAVRAFRPEILLMQCGVDAHANDLLAHLNLTSRTYREATTLVEGLSHELADSRLVVFGGGGYNVGNVARIWTIVAATLVGRNLQNKIPDSWKKMFEAFVGEPAPASLESDSEATAPNEAINSDIVSSLLANLGKRIALLKP
jgi:acetoin utilization protein AcuC